MRKTSAMRAAFVLPALILCGGCAPSVQGDKVSEADAMAKSSKAKPRKAELKLASKGRTEYSILLAADASPAEKHAAEELAAFLQQVTGAAFPVVPPEKAGPGPKIAVGPGAARTLAPDLDLNGLGADGIVVKARGKDLLLTGGPGAPRGTLYAVYTFLETAGCRWWAPNASTIPHRESLSVAAPDVRHVPILEYRIPFHKEAFDADWAVRNKCNGTGPKLDAARGGQIVYKGFVHTFNALVPPKEQFAKHPEWFSELGGKRTAERSQLCLTNPELLAFVIEQVKDWLKKTPEAGIVSVSQNDWHNNCQCAKCRTVDEEEGSPSGALLRFVNAVGEAIEKDFPHIAIDTLAYQYTRKPPRLARPRPNVIVRLCSIECSFARPLSHEQNRKFAEDIVGWSKICRRLYVWDYVTNFAHYVQPNPNLRVLGPNVRFFVEHGVRGLFEQGSYQSVGGEFSALRAWVLAKLLWDPSLDDRALIDEFLDGYYEAAAPRVREYIEMIHDKVEETGFYLGIYVPPSSPFLTLDVLDKGERLFQRARKAVAKSPDALRRVEAAQLGVRYVLIVRWPLLRLGAGLEGRKWPFDFSREDAIGDFERVCKENGITLLAEWHDSGVDTLRRKYLGPRRSRAAMPPGFENLAKSDWVDLQDELFELYKHGELSELRADETASDGVAARMPGGHKEWAVKMGLSAVVGLAKGEWTAYAVVRVEKQGEVGAAFTYGCYDNAGRKHIAELSVQAADVPDETYRVYKVGTFAPEASQVLWAAPAANAASVKAVWVDRFFLVRGKRE